MSDPSKEETFLKKYPPKTATELTQQVKDFEKAKEKYTRDVTALEQNFRAFNETEDPLVDPATDKPLCWIKRPTREEFEKMIPPELMKYKNSGEQVPKEIADKYEDSLFEMMAQLITIPKKDAGYWKKNASVTFQYLFSLHIAKVYEDLGISVANF